MQTHYEILGLSTSATSAEIKAAFRRLAKLYHPDKNPQGKEQFERVLIAYEVLIDTNRRKQYDLKIKYGSVSSANASSANQKKKQWGFSEEELKRRQYYQENYKTHFKKNKAQERPPLKKSYNEYKYILFATPLAVALLMFIITIYDRENPRTTKSVSTVTVNNDMPSTIQRPDYNRYFQNPVYDTAAKYNVLVNNRSFNEVIVALFADNGKFLRSAYIKPDYFVEIGQLPKGNVTIRMMMGKKWNSLKEHKALEVRGGFEVVSGYYKVKANAQNHWTIEIDGNDLTGFEKISEKEFFKKPN